MKNVCIEKQKKTLIVSGQFEFWVAKTSFGKVYMQWSWMEDSLEDESVMYITQSSSSTSATVIEVN